MEPNQSKKPEESKVVAAGSSPSSGKGTTTEVIAASAPSERGGKPNKRQRKGKGKGGGGMDEPLAPRYLEAQRVGTSPEEIAAWRAARRKNYPTVATSKRRAEAAAQVAAQATTTAVPVTEMNEKGSDKSSSEDAIKDTAAVQTADKITNSTLQEADVDAEAGYVSVSATIEEEATSTPKIEGSRAKKAGVKPCFQFLKGKCRHGQNCRYVHDAEVRAANNIKKRKEAEKRQFQHTSAKSGGKSSFLRKLLAVDIHKERQAVLQCIRHLLQHQAQAPCS